MSATEQLQAQADRIRELEKTLRVADHALAEAQTVVDAVAELRARLTYEEEGFQNCSDSLEVADDCSEKLEARLATLEAERVKMNLAVALCEDEMGRCVHCGAVDGREESVCPVCFVRLLAATQERTEPDVD